MKTKISSDETPEFYRLSVLIKQIDNTIQKSRENELRKFGITPEQAAALICIRSLGEKATSAEISRWLFRDESSMLVLIRRMIKQGLIIKTANRNNKHLSKIELTSKGLSAYSGAIKFLSLNEIFSCLTGKKRQQLFSLLDILRSRSFEVLKLDPEIYSGLFSKELILKNEEADSAECDNLLHQNSSKQMTGE
jgi:DNA-binding MarR family transcriptional regulator